MSKIIVWIWLGLSQGLSLPISALRRLDEGLTEWFAEKQTDNTADLKHRAKPPEFSQGNIKRVFKGHWGVGVALRISQHSARAGGPTWTNILV